MPTQLAPRCRGKNAAADVIGAVDHDASAHLSDRAGRRAIETAGEAHHAVTDVAGQQAGEVDRVALKRNVPRITGIVETGNGYSAAARSEVDGVREISGRELYVVRC